MCHDGVQNRGMRVARSGYECFAKTTGVVMNNPSTHPGDAPANKTPAEMGAPSPRRRGLAPEGPQILQPLPWSKDALAPVISARTVRVHYDKHHRGYVDK